MRAVDRLFEDYKTLKRTGTTTLQELSDKRNLLSGRMSHVKALASQAEENRALLRGLGVHEGLLNPHETWMRAHNVGTYDSTPRFGYDAIRDNMRQINISTNAGPSSAGPSSAGPSAAGPSGSSSNNN